MLNEIIKESLLISRADQIVKEIYLFGSFLHASSARGIDLLSIIRLQNQDDYSLAIKFRKLCAIFIKEKFNISLDMVILTEAEETEIGFVNKESAKLLWSDSA